MFSSGETYFIDQSSHIPGFTVVGQSVSIPNTVTQSIVELIVEGRG